MINNATMDSKLKAMDSKLNFTQIEIKDGKFFQLGDPFQRKWYKINDKTSKYRLGKLYHASIVADGMKDLDQKLVVRVIDFPRNSAYVIENFRNRMCQLYQVLNIDKIWLQPINYYIDNKLRVYLFYPEAISLFELLHSEKDDPHHFD